MFTYLENNLFQTKLIMQNTIVDLCRNSINCEKASKKPIQSEIKHCF